jgi:hypothetical protein
MNLSVEEVHEVKFFGAVFMNYINELDFLGDDLDTTSLRPVFCKRS